MTDATTMHTEIPGWLSARWRRIVARVLGSSAIPCAEHGAGLSDLSSGSYLCKMGLKVAEAPPKDGWKGNCTPFQLADLGVNHGNSVALLAFKENCEAFRGARMLPWSSGVRTREIASSAGDRDESSNSRAEAHFVVMIQRAEWREIRMKPARILTLLALAERED